MSYLLLFLLTKVNCGKISLRKKSNLQKNPFKSWLSLIIGISILIIIIVILILLFHQRINNKNEKVKRQINNYGISIVPYNNLNEIDTIETVGTPSEFTDHDCSQTEVKTII